MASRKAIRQKSTEATLTSTAADIDNLGAGADLVYVREVVFYNPSATDNLLISDDDEASFAYTVGPKEFFVYMEDNGSSFIAVGTGGDHGFAWKSASANISAPYCYWVQEDR